MSEGDVSRIRDEDVLRRMWQQTEDFSRKKEIRAHMYRLREERLRNLYSPEPSAEGKGVETAQTHVKSLLDQSFQGLKSKEVRDAGSPPKDFAYRGQDLKELSNAGWNVESENRTTDDGHTHVKAVHANIEGRYDVEGGKGQFAAVDHHKQAVTEYQDDNTSLKRNESSSNTAAHEEVLRKTDNGTQFSSTKSSSTSSKFQQVSSTKHEVPYTKDDYDLSKTNRNEEVRHVTKTSDYEDNLRRSDVHSGELVSRKVDYPDENTKVIVETRCLPDGTRVTSTRREFRVPVQSTRSEQHHSSSKNESRSYSTSSHQKVASDVKSSKIIRESDSRTNDIVDSQKHVDDYDFKRNIVDYTNQKDDYVQQRTNQQKNESKRFETRDSSSKITRETIDNRSDVIDSRRHVDDYNIKKNYQTDHSTQKDDYSTSERRVNQHHETKVNETDRREILTSDDVRKNQHIDHSIQKDYSTTQRTNRYDTKVDETDRREIITGDDNQNIQRDVKETRYVKDNEERIHNITRDKKVEEVVEKKTTNDQYQTTYQTDYTTKKISNDWSPSHQAWASTLRADTPSSTRPTTRASSPGSRTYQSSTSSLRSSVSPDKTYRKPPSRGGSPTKPDRYSPSRTTSDKHSSTHSTHSVTETKTNRYTSPDRKPPASPARHHGSPDRKPQDGRPRSSQSPEKRPQDYRPSSSPERKPGYRSSPTADYPRTKSPSRPYDGTQRPHMSPERKPGYQPSDGKSTPDSGYPRTSSPYRSTTSPERQYPRDGTRPSQSPDRKPGYQRPAGTTPSDYPRTTSPSRPYSNVSPRPSSSPERKPGYQHPTPTKTSPEKKPTDKYPGRDSPSPDRKPGYMRPTASKPDTPGSTKHTSPDRKSPIKYVPTQSPERKPSNKITNIKEDHYKFIDAETKMYTRTDREDVDYSKTFSPSPDRYQTPRDRSTSPSRKSPEDIPDYCRPESPTMRPTLRKGSRSPSPPKGPVTFTEDQVDRTECIVSDVTTKHHDYTEDITKKYRTPKRDSPERESPREPSPTKYGTYDKKHRTEKTEEVTAVTTKDTKDVKYDSLTRRGKTPKDNLPSPTKKSPRDSVSPTKPVDSPRETSPTKYGSYDTKHRTEKIDVTTVTTKDTKDVKYDSLTRREKTSKNDLPTPTKKSPRDSVSPTKPVKSPREPSPTKYGNIDTKYHTEETDVTTITTTDTKDVKYDSLTRREKTSKSTPDMPSPTKSTPRDSVSPTKHFDSPREPSPSKFGSYDRKHHTEKTGMTNVTTKETEEVKTDSLTRREKTPRNVLPSPTKKTPRDSVSPTKPVNSPREPSPPKYGSYDRKHRTEEIEEVKTTTTKDTKDIEYDSFTRREKTSKNVPDLPSPTKKSPRDSTSPTKPVESPREPSPTKYGTYDKKRRTEEVEEITMTTTDTKDVKYDSLTRREKTSPKKIPDLPASPSKKTPRDNVSPVKSPTKDAKYKHSTDFITTERTKEEINKKTTTKDHPRQLVTPSTSPTRKPKTTETEPSTGQSSPTTSVSGFVYFSSPKTERTVVTDLDDEEFYSETNTTEQTTTTYKRPETLNVERSPSPSKIPCRSPSPEKRVSPSKDSLPRKSSLKKPSSDFQSPSEKPPSSFRVSPTDDDKGFPGHKVVKKDRPEEPNDDLRAKTKPPFERRETYEDRCRKILGMMADDTNKTVTKETYVKEPHSNLSSPSVSPCHSPEMKERSPFTFVDKKETVRSNLTDFISSEQEDTVKKTTTRRDDVVVTDRKSKTPSRETSPAKLQDIISQKTVTKYDITTDDTQENIISKTVRESPDREVGYRKPKDSRPEDDRSSYPRTSPYRSTSPDKNIPQGYSKDAPIRSSPSPDRKPGYQKPTESQPRPEVMPANKYPKGTTPSRSSISPDRKPGYMRPTAATTKYESTTEDIQETTTLKTVRQSPDRETGYQKPKDSHPTSEHPRTASPSRFSHSKESPTRPSSSPEPQPGFQLPISNPKKKPTDKPKDSTRASVSPDRKPGYMKPTATTTTKYESTTTTEDIKEDSISKSMRQSSDRETGYPRTTSPSRPKDNMPTKPSHERKPSYEQPSVHKPSQEKKLVDQTPTRPSASPDRKPGYMRPTATTTTKYEENTTTEDTREDTLLKTVETKRAPSKAHQQIESPKRPEEPKHSRTPSPAKVSQVSENITEFIQSEREQEILDRVQKSLRKLSPNRDQRSSSRERSPGKSTISLQALDVESKNDEVITEEDFEITEKQTTTKTDVSRIGKPKDDKPKDQKPSGKTPSRTVSPVKKPTTTTPSKSDRIPESPTKSRSISPKKPISPTERPQSPQVPRASGIKPREPIPSQFRRPTPGNTSPTKSEKITTDIKKPTGMTKQNSFTKTTTIKTTTSKLTSPTKEPELKRTPTPKGINKENVSPKKEDIKVTRTPSDTTLKTKKPSPQRMKSKPEIQVNDMSPKTKQTTTTNRTQKSGIKEPQTKLAPKPKSATALNTSIDEDDVIIDVEQAKSSRENSPDRICPTPVSFLEDVGTPRFPDEVSEPDDEFRRRTHHTIHEAESIVDDIVEICEDDELFVKRTEVDKVTESDECLLSVTDKVSKFTSKIETVTKPKDATTQFKDTERRVHTDFIEENLKSDECLLSVSEKVNKFAKGPRDTKDRSPSRRIIDEYDTETVYQDDYTKLSVNDKAHLFVETAESVKTPKTKPAQKVERPDLSNVDESLKSDDCLLSVSDKVHKFVKTAEQFLSESQEVEEKERKVKEQYEKIMKHIVQDDDEETFDTTTKTITEEVKVTDHKMPEEKSPSFARETTSSHTKVKDYASPNLKPTERAPTVKITTLRSSEAVKKAKALFENIASTTQKTKDTKITKLTDIGVLNKSSRTDSTIVHHPSVEDGSPNITDESEVDSPHTPTRDRPASSTPTRLHHPGRYEGKPRSSPTRLTTQSPEVPRTKSPMRRTVETSTTNKTVLSRYPAAQTESPKHIRPESEKDKPQDKIPRHESKQPELEKEKPQDKVPSYQRPTKTSQIKEEKTIEETEVSSRRGSGKFGVELRRTSIERSTVSSERRRSSTDHHQPCIEDIFDLDLLEQMLEKVVGYEQRRRIRAQIRVARKRMETEHTDTTYTKTTRQTVTKTKSPDRRPQTKSPERQPKSTPQKTLSPERKPTPQRTTPSEHQPKETKPLLNGHAKEPSNLSDKRPRPQSPEKPRSAPVKTKSPVRQPSPDKKARTASPSKTPTKPKPSRFNEYATAYMKKVGLNETEKLKFTDVKTKKSDVDDRKTDQIKTKKPTTEDYQTVNQFEERIETKTTSMSKSFTERTSSKDTIEIVQLNGKRSPSPEKKRSPERHASPSERLYYRSPSPDFKRPKSDKKETIIRTVYETEPKVVKKETIVKTVYEERPKIDKKETIIKTVYDIEKKLPAKPAQEEKPSWVTNRNLKKITTDTRTFSPKKVEPEKPKYRAPSPSKVISKPLDVITSSYGPGPLDADGRPLFGIKALRNGASNYQVKGTVIRQEFHSRNGSEPEGTVSVTAYSTEPEDLEKLLQTQGQKPSRLHGLAAITTTKKFGGETGTTLKEAHSKEEHATLEQFTHSDRRVTDSRVENFETKSFDTRRDDTRSIEYTRSDDRTDRVDATRGSDRREDTRSTEYSRSDKRDDRTVRRDDRADATRSLDRKQDTRSTEARKNVRGQEEKAKRVEDRKERVERRDDKKTVRQSSVKSLTEKYIKSASDTSKTERSAYPKAGLILRTATMKDSISSDSSAHAGLGRTDSEHSLGSIEDSTVVTTRTEQFGDGRRTTTTTTRTKGQQERSFLDSSSKVTGVQDILTRMKNADIVIQEGDTTEDTEARALLNKFLGATVLMAGMQNYVTEKPTGKVVVKQETVRSSTGGGGTSTSRTSRTEHLDIDLDQCWDERVLRKLLEESSDYEQRRRLRARIRTLMAEQEACASAVTEALAAAGEAPDTPEANDAREEEEVTVTSSMRRNSSEKTVSSSTTTKTSKVIESMTRPGPKPVSPFAKFRQLEKQNSTNTPNSPKTPQSPGSPAQPYFKFTDPALQASALTIKERLLQWCRDKTRDYENVKLENFSTSWADGLAFCALLHHFLPNAFDYSKLTPDKRRHNFTLAFKVADEKAGIYPLLDVDDMVAMRKPDWKCVFTYVQSIHRRFKDQP